MVTGETFSSRSFKRHTRRDGFVGQIGSPGGGLATDPDDRPRRACPCERTRTRHNIRGLLGRRRDWPGAAHRAPRGRTDRTAADGRDPLADRSHVRRARPASDRSAHAGETRGTRPEPRRGAGRGRSAAPTTNTRTTWTPPAASSFDRCLRCSRLRAQPSTSGATPSRCRPPRRSTAASSTTAAPPSGFHNLTTTSPDHCWRVAPSHPNYTLDCEELITPLNHQSVAQFTTATPAVAYPLRMMARLPLFGGRYDRQDSGHGYNSDSAHLAVAIS